MSLLVLMSLLLVVCASCERPDDPAEKKSGLEVGLDLAREYAAAVGEKDPALRGERLGELEQRLASQVDRNRLARLIMVRTVEARGSAAAAVGDHEEAERSARRAAALSESYLARDPADGRLRGFLVSQATQRDDFERVWRLLEGSAATVDLETADPLVRAAASLLTFGPLRPEVARRARTWLLPFYGTLIARARNTADQRDLLERLLCEKGLVLLAQGRSDDARRVLAELESLGPPGPHFFRLEMALDAR